MVVVLMLLLLILSFVYKGYLNKSIPHDIYEYEEFVDIISDKAIMVQNFDIRPNMKIKLVDEATSSFSTRYTDYDLIEKNAEAIVKVKPTGKLVVPTIHVNMILTEVEVIETIKGDIKINENNHIYIWLDTSLYSDCVLITNGVVLMSPKDSYIVYLDKYNSFSYQSDELNYSYYLYGGAFSNYKLNDTFQDENYEKFEQCLYKDIAEEQIICNNEGEIEKYNANKSRVIKKYFYDNLSH